MCEKKIDCWQPADLSKTAGNWERKAKIQSKFPNHSTSIYISATSIYELIIPPKLLALALRWALGFQANWLYHCGDCETADPANVYWQDSFSSNIVHSTDVGSMLGQRRRRWSSIKTALGFVWVDQVYLVISLVADINAVRLYFIG